MSNLLDGLPRWQLDAIANHMSDEMSKQQFHKQFITNLQKELTKEELLKLSSFTGISSSWMSIMSYMTFVLQCQKKTTLYYLTTI